jgi:outer membrane immunogenic protein
MLLKKLVLATALLSISFSAYSQDSSVEDTGWFMGGSLGQFETEFETGYSEKDSSFGIYGGYNFNKWFGLEASFGSVEHEIDGSDVSIGNLSVAPKFTVVINDVVSLYAKLGLSVVVLTDDEYDEDWNGVGTTYGVGAQFGITKNLKLRIGYDLIDVTLENDDYEVDTDLTQTALGVHYQF